MQLQLTYQQGITLLEAIDFTIRLTEEDNTTGHWDGYLTQLKQVERELKALVSKEQHQRLLALLG